MILIYTPEITNRIRYIFKFILGDIIGVKSIAFTSDKEEFLAYKSYKINYSHQPFNDELFFASKQLLVETGIKNFDVNVFEWNGYKVFFPVGKNSLLPFDVFAASFYLITRYEEYLPTIYDKHDRFDAHESIAYKNNFLTSPVVNQWAELVKNCIVSRYPNIEFAEKKYKYISTVDIDNAFAYREKGITRVIGGYSRAIFHLDFKEIKERTRVHFNRLKDPYDTYDHLRYLEKKYQLETIYFFLVADYDVNDKNVPTQSKVFRHLIKSIADTSPVGIHPSYASNKSADILAKEISRLEKILNRHVTKSRQHFLKLQFPNTYRRLIDLDITDDYTMGYANEIGFRASVCTPFNFYDLDLELETKLKIHPFQVMDATLNLYMKLSPEEVMPLVKPMINEVKKVKGTFVTLWHNETLCDQKQWLGWKNTLEKIMNEASKSVS